MTSATPLLAYLQSLQQGQRQSEQMRQQFGMQNLEQQKNNAQFLMELGDKTEARKQQRQQFDWAKADRDRQSLLDSLAQADRDRLLTKEKEDRTAAVNAYIQGKASPLSAAYNKVLSTRKQVEDLAKSGKRMLPSQLEALRTGMSKTESDYAAALKQFQTDTAGDTTYGIDWNPVTKKYELGEFAMPDAFRRRGVAPQETTTQQFPSQFSLPATSQGGGPMGTGPTIIDGNEPAAPAGVPVSMMGSPLDKVFQSGVLPANSFLGIGVPPTKLATSQKPTVVPQVDPLTALAALRTRLAKNVQGGEWSPSEIDVPTNEIINKIVDAYFSNRGSSFRSNKFNDQVYGGNLTDLLNDYRGHIGNEAEIQRFLDSELVGDLADYAPNVVGRIASRISDKGFIDPKVIERLANESKNARAARADELQQTIARKEEGRKQAKFNQERGLWQLENKEATLRVQKLRKEIDNIGKADPAKPESLSMVVSRAVNTWDNVQGQQTSAHLNETIKSLERDIVALKPKGKSNVGGTTTEIENKRTQIAALRGLVADVGVKKGDFVRAIVSGNKADAMRLIDESSKSFRQKMSAVPGLAEVYNSVPIPQVTSGGTGVSGRAGGDE